MDRSLSEEEIAKLRLDPLEPGDFQLVCTRCGYKAEKNSALNPKCPDCRAQMWLLTQVAKPIIQGVIWAR